MGPTSAGSINNCIITVIIDLGEPTRKLALNTLCVTGIGEGGHVETTMAECRLVERTVDIYSASSTEISCSLSILHSTIQYHTL